MKKHDPFWSNDNQGRESKYIERQRKQDRFIAVVFSCVILSCAFAAGLLVFLLATI